MKNKGPTVFWQKIANNVKKYFQISQFLVLLKAIVLVCSKKERDKWKVLMNVELIIRIPQFLESFS